MVFFFSPRIPTCSNLTSRTSNSMADNQIFTSWTFFRWRGWHPGGFWGGCTSGFKRVAWFQPIWNICSSNWIIFEVGLKIKKWYIPENKRMSPKKGPFQKERILFKPVFFRGHVSFQGSKHQWNNHVATMFPYLSKQPTQNHHLNK